MLGLVRILSPFVCSKVFHYLYHKLIHELLSGDCVVSDGDFRGLESFVSSVSMIVQEFKYGSS
jgi:hypothetical protein